jgi:hypothetical protein
MSLASAVWHSNSVATATDWMVRNIMVKLPPVDKG